MNTQKKGRVGEKLTIQQLREIKKRRQDARRYKQWANGLSRERLAEKFEVSHHAIYRIVSNKRWQEGGNHPESVDGFSIDDARLIRECWRQKNEWLKKWRENSAKRIAQEYGIAEDFVLRIERRNDI